MTRRPRGASSVTEPKLLSWSEVEQHLSQYERALRDQPELREQVLMLAGKMRTYTNQIPGPMPAAVAQAFDRIIA